jgi:hypothetical protein
MGEGTDKFACDGCGRSYTWKPELAGKRAKCKCGQVLNVPQELPQAGKPQEEDLYDFADGPSHPSPRANPVANVPIAAAPIAAKTAARALPLGYQRGPTAREKDLASSSTFIDKKRDIYIPCTLLGIGLFLSIGYYILHYQLGPGPLLFTSIGLLVMTILETGILLGFAFTVAGPLGVSFGSIHTAILKFAAIILFCDGVTTWLDGLLAHYGGGGFFGFGVFGFPVALAIYWILFINLFSMDPGDSWLVVVLLSVLYRIVRLVLFILILRAILGGVGVAAANIPMAAQQSAVRTTMDDDMDHAKEMGLLLEAKKYINDTGRRAELSAVQEWYNEGAKNVWYQVVRDINGHASPMNVVVELPDDKTARAKCYASLKTWYAAFREDFNPANQPDDGEHYLIAYLQ